MKIPIGTVITTLLIFAVILLGLFALEGYILRKNEFWAFVPICAGYLLGLLRMRAMASQGQEEEERKFVASPPRPLRTPRVSYRRERR